MANKDSMVQALTKAPAKANSQNDRPIGLVDNTSGEPFQCGTCEYFKKGICENDHPKLKGQKVEAEWCCNLYDHEGMRTIID